MRQANYSESIEIRQQLEERALNSSEPVTLEDAQELYASADLATRERFMVADVIRANFQTLGEIIANLWDTPDNELAFLPNQTAEEYREELAGHYVKMFTSK